MEKWMVLKTVPKWELRSAQTAWVTAQDDLYL